MGGLGILDGVRKKFYKSYGFSPFPKNEISELSGPGGKTLQFAYPFSVYSLLLISVNRYRGKIVISIQNNIVFKTFVHNNNDWIIN